MADFPKLHQHLRSASTRLASANQISALSSAIITGFGLFGLASNGTCLAALMHPGPHCSKNVPAGADDVSQTSGSECLPIMRNDSRLAFHRTSQCRH